MSDPRRLSALIACGLLIALLIWLRARLSASGGHAARCRDRSARRRGSVTGWGAGRQQPTTGAAFASSSSWATIEAIVRPRAMWASAVPFSLTESEKKHTLDLDAAAPVCSRGACCHRIQRSQQPASASPMARRSMTTDASGAIAHAGSRGTRSGGLRSGAGASHSASGGGRVAICRGWQPRFTAGAVRDAARAQRDPSLEPDGTPVAGAEVRVGAVSASTDAEGRYELRYVEPGEPIVVASAAHRPRS